MSLIRQSTVSERDLDIEVTEYFTMYTTIDITETDDYRDESQKDFESMIHVIALRAMPVIIKKPKLVDDLREHGAKKLRGKGWIFTFAFEHDGVHTLDTLTNELDRIVLSKKVIKTKKYSNVEFTRTEV